MVQVVRRRRKTAMKTGDAEWSPVRRRHRRQTGTSRCRRLVSTVADVTAVARAAAAAAAAVAAVGEPVGHLDDGRSELVGKAALLRVARVRIAKVLVVPAPQPVDHRLRQEARRPPPPGGSPPRGPLRCGLLRLRPQLAYLDDLARVDGAVVWQGVAGPGSPVRQPLQHLAVLQQILIKYLS